VLGQKSTSGTKTDKLTCRPLLTVYKAFWRAVAHDASRRGQDCLGETIPARRTPQQGVGPPRLSVPDYGSIAVVTGMLHRKDTKTGVLPSFRDSAAKDSQAPSTMLMDSPNEAKNAMRFNNLSHEVRGSCRWTHFFRACERFSLAAFPGARSLPLKRPSWIAVGMPRLFDFEQRALPCRKGALHDLLKTI
jgi:hypothetical protein